MYNIKDVKVLDMLLLGNSIDAIAYDLSIDSKDVERVVETLKSPEESGRLLEHSEYYKQIRQALVGHGDHEQSVAIIVCNVINQHLKRLR